MAANITTVQFQFELFDTNLNPVSGLSSSLQYFNGSTNKWINLNKRNINEGIFKCDISSSSSSLVVANFFKQLDSGNIKDYRIVLSNDLYLVEKTNQLTTELGFKTVQKKSQLIISFDARVLVKEVKKENIFNYYVLVTNPKMSEEQEIELTDVPTDDSAPISNVPQMDYYISNDHGNELENCFKSNQELQKSLEFALKENNELKNQIKQTSSDNKTLEKNFNALNNNYEKLLDQKIELVNSNKELIKQVEELKAALELEKNNLFLCQQEKSTLSQNQKELQKVIEKNQQQIDKLKLDIEQISSLLSESENKLTTAQNEIEILNKNLQQANANLESHYSSIQDLNSQILDLHTQKLTYKNEIEQVKDLLSNYANLISQLELENAELKKDVSLNNKPISINTLYSNLVGDLKNAQVQNQHQEFKLSNISIKMRTQLTNTESGLGINFINPEDGKNVNGNTISEITMDIVTNPTISVEQGNLPNLIGYTESAVRNILNNQGLKLNPVYQQNKLIVNGDSFKQSPQPYSPVNPSQIITVIFSKNE